MLTYTLLGFIIYCNDISDQQPMFLVEACLLGSLDSVGVTNRFAPRLRDLFLCSAGPKWYPFVGSFPQFKNVLMSTKDLANAFITFSKQYKSDIIGLKLGSENVVIVFSAKLVKSIYLDDKYLGRPDIFFNRLRTMGTMKGITLSSGQLWENQRTFAAKYLRKTGYGKRTMETKIMNEIKEIIKIIDLNPIDVDFKKLTSFSILNVLWAFVAGTELLRDDVRVAKLVQLMHRRTLTFDMSGSTLNYFPWLRFFAPEKFGYNLMKEINLELEGFLKETIKKHLYTWTEKNNDLIYAYISEIKRYDGSKDTYYTYEQLQMICIDLFYAGSTVINTAIDFLFFAMAMHQDVQTKVQDVLDETFDPSIPLEYSDRAKVPYIEAVICEIQRCYTNTPVLPPRSPMENADLDGYEIPKGSTVFLCFDSIFKNSEYFDQPNIFKPERFLNSSGELISQEGFFPFGLGKRKCFGNVLAKVSLFMIFTEIMRKYKVYPVNAIRTEQEKFIPGIVRSKQKCPIKLVKRF